MSWKLFCYTWNVLAKVRSFVPHTYTHALRSISLDLKNNFCECMVQIGSFIVFPFSSMGIYKLIFWFLTWYALQHRKFVFKHFRCTMWTTQLFFSVKMLFRRFCLLMNIHCWGNLYLPRPKGFCGFMKKLEMSALFSFQSFLWFIT